MLCKLPGNFREGDKGTKAISGKPHTEQSWDGGQPATHLEVPSAEMADRGNQSSNASQASPPTPCLLFSEPRAPPTSPTRATLGRSWGWEEWLRRTGMPDHAAACTVSLTVPLNLDHPALPETNTPTDRHVGTCFHRNLSFGLLCAKTIQFF